MPSSDKKKSATVPRIPRPEAIVGGNRSKSLPVSGASDPRSSNVESGIKSPSGLRRTLRERLGESGSRTNRLRNLMLERKARQRYLTKLMRRDSFQGSMHGSSHGGASGEVASPVPVRAKRKGILAGFLENGLPFDSGKEEVQMRGSVSTSMLSTATTEYELTEAQKEQMKKMSASMKELKRKVEEFKYITETFPIEIRIDNFTYTVPIKSSSNTIQTVYNSSPVYKIVKFFKNIGTDKDEEAESVQTSKVILGQISLALKPGRMYLLLGPPASGKTTLLKAIAGRLSARQGEESSGTVTYNGRSFADKTHFHIENAIGFIDQLDRHAPRLTVDETFEFAFQCKRGGTHERFEDQAAEEGDEDAYVAKTMAKRADDERLYVNMNLATLGLTSVRDTFVGDNDVRGVSGGQRRRVTAGEMMLGLTPILLGDEISNGLDASSTFEMVQMLTYSSKEYKRTRVISLLQPSPETVALFDEIILLAEGKVLYAGPITQVEDYFGELGYKPPPYMDVADFLQLLSSPADCENLFHPPPGIAESQPKPYSADQLADLFRESIYGEHIKASLKAPYRHVWGSSHDGVEVEDGVGRLDDRSFYRKFANSFPRSVVLNLKRNLTLWVRDRRVLIANAAKNIIMGISVGGVFFQTTDTVSILGVFFQGMLFIMLTAMTSAPGFVDERIIYYKQADANFFSAYPFVLGKAISKLPQTTMDCFAFGTILYFMVGLATTAENYFIFMAIIISFNVLMNELLFVFTTYARTKDTVQVMAACLVFFFILFSGFIISPAVIPSYYNWIYWYNPMAWAYRGVVVNQFRSSEYTQEEADSILFFGGFVDSNGDPFGIEWVGYTFVYLLSHTLISLLASAAILQRVRVRMIAGVTDEQVEHMTEGQPTQPVAEANISFKPVTLSFEDVCYDVKASTGNETLRLLNNIDGAFKSGRLCALMGTSGAGKTTLMDVIALRKTTGTVEGDMRLNGYPQDPVPFRRCSGYVEQFNTLTPQLTVRETVLFSARLRLDALKVGSDDDKRAFVDNVLGTLELKPLSDVLVGSADEGGLSFEQKKRLSIAVELAASPSILFLDEPTTGLDARSALLVVKLLRKVADQGRTICATIHQPSSAVFDLFDDLLLLKKGGHVVYFGETGDQSKELIRYFEEHGANPIEIGDNPANWMLREIQSDANPNDLVEEYHKSREYKTLKRRLADVRNTQIEALEITFPTLFAAPADLRQRLMNKRLQTIYWRSPTYNLSRLLVCSIIALILGSVFLGRRFPEVLTESDMRASLSVIFLSFIIIGILSITSVLPVMLSIRDVFYRHRASGMLDNVSLGWALGTAEKWFIVLASFLFCLVFLGVSGITTGLLRRAIRFWGIFTFNLAIYSYFGQAFMCLVPSMTTAQILASVFIGLNNFFSGLIVRPQFMTGFFAITYWITPGHYVYEGLVLAQFHGDLRTVIAANQSEFYDYLECGERNVPQCNGTVELYVDVFFGGKFNKDNELQDILVLALFLVGARVMTFFALKKFNFSNM